MLAKEIKPGAVVNYDGAPILIQKVQVQTPSARGAATLYKYRGRNLVTRQKQDITLKGGESLVEADFTRRPCKLMYTDATHMFLLDQEDYNQFSIELSDVEEEAKYITEELEGMLALIYNDECVGVKLPTTVELLVTQCDPGVKGDSATKTDQACHRGNGAGRDRAGVPGARCENQSRHAHGRLHFACVSLAT